MCFGGSDASAAIAAQQEQQQALVNQAVANVNNAFAGFNPAFYQQATNAYLSSALPAVASQFQQMQRQVASTLADRGLLQSSAARDLGSSLAQEMARQQTGIANQATNFSQNLAQNISNEKSNLINQAMASANPAQAATQAAAAAANFQAPSPAPTIGNLFQDWATLFLAHQYANAGNPSSSGPFTFGQFGNQSNSTPPSGASFIVGGP